MALLQKRLPASFATLRATLQLLYRSHPRAFVVSALASLPEPLFFPAFLLVLHQMLQGITEPAGRVQLTPAAEASGIALVVLLLVQRLGIIVRDASSTILQKIVLFTTHRYDTIRRADTIVVLVDGQIAEVGSHDELERKAGAFWSLYLGQGSRPSA